jgi:hypothetical protein
VKQPEVRGKVEWKVHLGAESGYRRVRLGGDADRVKRWINRRKDVELSVTEREEKKKWEKG